MAYLPTEHKHLIQTSYVRFRELAKELPEIGNKVTIGRFAHWGGLAMVVVGIIRSLIGRNELPDFVGGLALLCVLFGWAYKHDAMKKQSALWDERQAIQKSMDEIGVLFSDSFRGDVTVYSGGIADGNRVFPLHDGSYRESA